MEKEIKIKQGWDEITLMRFLQIIDIEQSEYENLIDKSIEYVKIIYDVDGNKIPYKDFQALVHSLSFMAKPIKPNKMRAKYTLNGRDYTISTNLNNITTAQFIDFNEFAKENDYIGILSVVMWPSEANAYMEGYDIEQVKVDLEELPVTDAEGIKAFFLCSTMRLQSFIPRYLRWKIRKMKKSPAKKELMKQLQDLEQILASFPSQFDMPQ